MDIWLVSSDLQPRHEEWQPENGTVPDRNLPKDELVASNPAGALIYPPLAQLTRELPRLHLLRQHLLIHQESFPESPSVSGMPSKVVGVPHLSLRASASN